jgi:3-methylcrotonyl-CoA carboxylase beta subunit
VDHLGAVLRDPAETRQALALGISAAFNAPIPEAKFGVFRM